MPQYCVSKLCNLYCAYEMGRLVGKRSTAAESGAALASLLIDPSYVGVSGRYYDRGEETTSSALSYDRANARELWEASLAMAGSAARNPAGPAA